MAQWLKLSHHQDKVHTVTTDGKTIEVASDYKYLWLDEDGFAINIENKLSDVLLSVNTDTYHVLLLKPGKGWLLPSS